jgi:hypothetical protein
VPLSDAVDNALEFAAHGAEAALIGAAALGLSVGEPTAFLVIGAPWHLGD